MSPVETESSVLSAALRFGIPVRRVVRCFVSQGMNDAKLFESRSDVLAVEPSRIEHERVGLADEGRDRGNDAGLAAQVDPKLP